MDRQFNRATPILVVWVGRVKRGLSAAMGWSNSNPLAGSNSVSAAGGAWIAGGAVVAGGASAATALRSDELGARTPK